MKVTDDGVMHFEESCFRTLSIVQRFSLETTFRKLTLLPSSGKKGGEGVAPTLWGPLERASLNHWSSEKHRTMDKVLKQDSSKWITSWKLYGRKRSWHTLRYCFVLDD
jgi:hypothetical protein